jgi:hypothetical protein
VRILFVAVTVALYGVLLVNRLTGPIAVPVQNSGTSLMSHIFDTLLCGRGSRLPSPVARKVSQQRCPHLPPLAASGARGPRWAQRSKSRQFQKSIPVLVAMASRVPSGE